MEMYYAVYSRHSPGIEFLTIAHEKIRMMHDMYYTQADLHSHNSITSIIIPSTAYLGGIDKTRSMPPKTS
jgi:hypothetical protein